MMFVRPSVRLSVRLFVCLSGTGVHCDHMVHFTADLSLRLESTVLGTLTPKHVHLFPAVLFQFQLEERWGMDVQTRRRIKFN